MSKELNEWRKERFEGWIRGQIDSWLHEYGAWDDWLEDEDDDFDEEDWKYICDHLIVDKIIIKEKE